MSRCGRCLDGNGGANVGWRLGDDGKLCRRFRTTSAHCQSLPRAHGMNGRTRTRAETYGSRSVEVAAWVDTSPGGLHCYCCD